MVAGIEELGPAIGVMHEADRMTVLGVRVPVEAPTPLDVAIVSSPEDADAREDPQQDPCIEDTGVEPVAGAARVQPFCWEEARE